MHARFASVLTCVRYMCRFGGRGQLLSNGPDQDGPKQIADRPWDASGGQGPSGRPQPPSRPPPSGLQNLSGNQNRPSILAAVGQQVSKQTLCDVVATRLAVQNAD